MNFRSIPLAVAALCTACAGAQTPSPVKVQLEQYVTGLPNITDITHAGDDRLFVVQRNGTVRIIDGDGQLLPGAFLTINVNSGSNEQGLLGLAFDPDYADNGHFFVYYTAGSSAGFSRVARYTVSEGDPNTADPASAVELFTVTQPFSNHNGGDLAFGPDGHLYVSLGDGGSGGDPQDHGQRMNSRLGKILRIDVGELPWTVPPDNPFVGATGDTLPEIWASGLRNPWRMGFDRETGDLWIGDVGQNTWEEIDFWPAGDHSGPNFGWRCFEGFATYNSNDCQPAANYVQPVKTHPTNQWCSVIGGRVYRGDQYYRLSGLYIYTDHCYGRVFSLQPDGDGGWAGLQLTTSSVSSPSVIAENVHGELFLGTHGNNGRVYRILDVCPMPQPAITVEGNVLTSSPADGYTWFLDGEPIPDATEQSLEALVNGHYTVLADLGTDCQLVSEPVHYASTGVAEGDEAGVQVHPVPARDRLAVSGLDGAAVWLRLVDTTGREVVKRRVQGPGQQVLDVGALASGNYVLMVMDKAGRELLSRVVTVEH